MLSRILVINRDFEYPAFVCVHVNTIFSFQYSGWGSFQIIGNLDTLSILSIHRILCHPPAVPLLIHYRNNYSRRRNFPPTTVAHTWTFKTLGFCNNTKKHQLFTTIFYEATTFYSSVSVFATLRLNSFWDSAQMYIAGFLAALYCEGGPP